MEAFVPKYSINTPTIYIGSVSSLLYICALALKEVYVDTSFNSFALAIDSIENNVTCDQFLNHRQYYGGSLCIGTALEVKKRLPNHIRECTRLHMPHSQGNRSSMHGFLGVWFKDHNRIGIVILDTHSNFGFPILVEPDKPATAKWNSKPNLTAVYQIRTDNNIEFQRDEPQPLLFSEKNVTDESALELSLTTLAQYPYLAIITPLEFGGPLAFVKLHLEEKYIKFFYIPSDTHSEFTVDFTPHVTVNWDDFPAWISEDYAKVLHCNSKQQLQMQLNTIVLNYNHLIDYRRQLKDKFIIS